MLKGPGENTVPLKRGWVIPGYTMDIHYTSTPSIIMKRTSGYIHTEFHGT